MMRMSEESCRKSRMMRSLAMDFRFRENDDFSFDHKSRKISSAAFFPQAPRTPPPGWLAAPQR
jgi:hypothetical protein